MTGWIERPEIGGAWALQLMHRFALLCGRRAARLALWPVALYYLARRGPERRASRAYLARVLDGPPRIWHPALHAWHFAAVTLDRIYLLAERFKRFDIQCEGLQALREWMALDRGVLLLGAHVGSFDALRALSMQQPDIPVRAVIDTAQSPVLSALLAELNPQLARAIIDPRKDGVSTALAIKEALDQKSLVTMMADRARPGDATIDAEFLGSPAPFPTAPWLLAAALEVPVVLCFGLYRGGNRYHLRFEPFAERLEIPRARREACLAAIVQRYADRVAHQVRGAPYNWFNFYDFWLPQDSPGTPARSGARPGVAGDVRRSA